jgi:hypothetical protein
MKRRNVSFDIMTTLTTRNEIVKTKRIIGSELTKMQKAFYDEEVLQYYKDENEEHLYWEKFDCIKNEETDYTTFNKIIGIDGLIITKLDGTSKGGIAVALAHDFAKPIFAIGVGEKITDLQEFNAKSFTYALLDIENS